MSTMNIAIAGGVVLLILVLLKLRRADADEPKAPRRGASKVRGERRRKRGKDAPPAPPEPMPLAAAAGESAATAEAARYAPPAAEWPPADAPAPGAWPPAAEEEPVEWPDAAAPAAEPYAEGVREPAGDGPVAPGAEPHVWAEDEIVTEPGWPMPGEVDVPWSPPASAEPAPPAGVAPSAVPAWEEEAATAAPERFEWLGEVEEGQIPAWDPAPADAPATTSWEPAEEVAPSEPLAWTAPEEDAPPAWDDYAGEPVEDAQPTGAIRIPVIEDPADAIVPVADDFPQAEGFDPVEAVVEVEPFSADAPEGPFSAPGSFEEDFELPAYVPQPPAGDAPPRAEDAVVPEPEPVAEYEAQVQAAFAPAFETEAVAVPAFEPVELAPDPVVAPEPEPVVTFAPEPVVAVAPSPAPAADAPAWWDEAVEAPPAAGVPAPAADDPARTGRFALGGFAVQPGQQALGGVSFRVELPEAPAAWAVAGPGEDALPAGTIVLRLDGAINCSPDDLEVVMEPGFAPTTQGFTVRVAAPAAGPFAASGTFRVR